MKKSLMGAVILALTLARAGAATWEGSAVAGGAGDFPADGMYAACNSFPRDSVIELSNIETGKAVTVTIISNVDNPGVFIALSPKTAEALGMKPGEAIRVRAVSLAASQAEATLPAARTGVSADPDFNPRVFFEREKAALQAAASETPAAVAQAPAAVAPAAVAPAAVAPATTVQAPAAQPTPTTPAAVAAAPPAPTQPVAAPAAPEQKAEVLARAEASPVTTPVAPQGLKEPQPAAAAAPAVAQTPAAATAPAPTAPPAEQKAEVLARSAAVPIAGQAGAPGLNEPQPVIAEAPSAAAVDTLARPSGKAAGAALSSLSEPSAPQGKPTDKPEAVLSRVAAPAAQPNVPLLTDAEPAAKQPAAAVAEQGAETLALTTPSSMRGAAGVELGEMAEAELPYAPEAVFVQKPASPGAQEAVELAEAEAPADGEAILTARPAMVAAEAPADVAMGEPVAPKQPIQTGVVAIGGSRPTPAAPAVADMADPDIPSPSENLVAAKPGKIRTDVAIADEPGVLTPLQTGTAPTTLAAERPSPMAPSMAVADLAEPSAAAEPATGAFAAGKPAMASSPSVALATPVPPSPTESLAASRPAAPAAAGETVVALEPALPRPPAAAAPAAAPTVTAAAEPAAPAAVATIKGNGGIAEPPASLPVIKGLAKGSYYIQIGVYGTNDALLAATNGLRPTYPVAVERIATKAGTPAYRLYIGPIARDESGLALLKIRALGYKDAFVKEGS